MKFILNTSFVPYFCVLFDQKNKIVAQENWEDGKKSGEIVWNFFEAQKIRDTEITFIGGISGPGGFSHLRTSSVVMQVLSFYFDLPVFQARADLVVCDFLEKNNKQRESFALNSFGQGLFLPFEGLLNRCEDEQEVKENLEDKAYWVDLLPAEKQKYFSKTLDLPLKGIEASVLETLSKQEPQKQFVPDYEYPAVK